MKTDLAHALAFLRKNIDRIAAELVPLWHPLGFVSCVVDESRAPLITRVHFWPANERRVKNPDWPIHTHSYSLNSLVLSGAVKDIQYDVIAGNQWCVYSVRYYEGGSEIIRTPERVIAVPSVVEMRYAGQEYEVPRGVFHQTQVEYGQSAVTLVSLSQHGSEAPKVLGTEQAERYPYDRTAFDAELFWGEVRKALKRELRSSPDGL